MMKKAVHSLEELQEYLDKNYPAGTTRINFGSEYQIPVGLEGIRLLVRHLHWDIHLLNISMHQAGDDGLQLLLHHQLAHPHNWTALRELFTTKNQITNDGLKGIDTVSWPSFQCLSLEQNKIDRFGVEILARANFGRTLKKLLLGGNSIGIGGCEVLSRTDWPCFERLGLNYNFITNEGLAFLQLAHWPGLLEVNLSNNKLDARGMAHLQHAHWPNLQIINLSRNRIGLLNDSQLTDTGCLHLARMRTRSLKNFGVFGNDISLNGIRIVFRAGILAPNCFLELVKNKFTFAEIEPYLQEFDLFCNEFDD